MLGAMRKRWLIFFLASVLPILLVGAPVQAKLFSDQERSIALILLLVPPIAATVGFNSGAVYPAHPTALQYLDEVGAGMFGGTTLAVVASGVFLLAAMNENSHISSYCVPSPSWCIVALNVGVFVAHVVGTAGGVLVAGGLNGAHGNALLTVAGAAASDLVIMIITQFIQFIQLSSAIFTGH